ncbi:MAG: type II toxin-antitoxin system prevent-host-death family antitoxin [Actinomycetota bacterium]
MSAEVGIRELRQDLSRYLRRVRKGERLVVTDRNRPVALLTPLPENEDPWERLIAEGKMTPPTRRFEDLPPPLKLEGGPTLSETLEELRRESWEDEAEG